MYSWQKINLEQDPWWLEYRLNIDNMQGHVWRSSSGLWRAVLYTPDGTRQVLAVEQNTEAAAKEAVEAAILRQQLPPAEV